MIREDERKRSCDTRLINEIVKDFDLTKQPLSIPFARSPRFVDTIFPLSFETRFAHFQKIGPTRISILQQD